MLTIFAGTPEQLQGPVESELAAYRHKVFVETLGWKIPGADAGAERDQFDRADTIYVVARDGSGAICGCARLLPTTGAYLLASVFPHLLGEGQPPRCTAVWELSRYTTQSVNGDAVPRDEAQERFRSLLRGVVQAATKRGAQRLITFSYLGVERIARAFGLHTHRAGAPRMVDEKPVVAFWIELDAQTHAALGLAFAGSPAAAAAVCTPADAPCEQARVA